MLIERRGELGMEKYCLDVYEPVDKHKMPQEICQLVEELLETLCSFLVVHFTTET